jgi:hypothetical protein
MGWLSFLKFLFKPLRAVTSTIYNGLSAKDQKGCIVRFLQIVFLPCIWIHHKFLRYLSKITLIHTAMWSTNFWQASKQSYYLVRVRHGDRGEGNEALIEFVLRQIKVSPPLT